MFFLSQGRFPVLLPGASSTEVRPQRRSHGMRSNRRFWGTPHQGSSSFTVVRDPDSVAKGNDPQHLLHAYIHLFTTPVCCVSEYL